MAKDAKARNRPAEAANMDAEAIKHLKKAISLNPKKKNMIYNNLGMIYAYEAKYDTALTMFRTALDLGIRPAPIWRNIGQIEGECQNWNKAIESYRNAIKNKRTLKNMYTDMLNGALYAVENDDYIEKVQEILEHGVSNEDLAPFDSVIFNIFLRRDVKLAEDYKDLAIAYEKNGQINEAIHHFRKALEVRPKWSAIYNRIGIIFARHDMLGEAKTAFRDALRVDPENNGAKSNLEHVLKRMKDEG